MKADTRTTLRQRVYAHRGIYMLMIPGFIYFIVFKYAVMAGNIFAFMELHPLTGVWGAQWVGMKHFIRLFSYQDLVILLRNTFVISLMRLVYGFPVPLILAILLNDIRRPGTKRLLQSTIYLPHFISWVVVVAITLKVLDPTSGIINRIIEALGGESVFFMTKPALFRPILVVQGIWKEAGWGTVIYLAALAGVPPQLYESAEIDGCNKWQRALHVTLPSIRSTAVVLLILSIGRLINENFHQILLMLNPLVSEVGEIFETYNYRVGVLNGEFGYSTAVGFFKATVALFMVVAANSLARRIGERGVY
jgi:putative aldouronate transport system permease protein